MAKSRNDLTFDEMTLARQFFHHHAEEYITDEFQLRTILSEMGQYPNEAELKFCLDAFDSKLSFNNFCNYLMFLKNRYQRPEPKDVDTLRAFVALGGKQDRKGDISTDDLRATCKHFELTIDIDAMLKEVDEDGSGTIDYEEFSSMWKLAQQGMVVAEEDDELEDDEESRRKKLRRNSSLRIEEEPALDDDDNINMVRQFLFPLQRKATVQAEVLAKRKSNVGSRKSVARLPSLYPSSSNAPGKAKIHEDIQQVDSDDDEAEREREKEEKRLAAQATHRQSNAFRPPSPQILDFRRSHKSKNKNSSMSTPRGTNSTSSPRRRGQGNKLPTLTPRAPGTSSRQPNTARSRY